MRLIDVDALWDAIEKHSYPVRHGVGFYDVDHGITMDGIRQCIAEAPTVVPKRYEWISVKDRLPDESGYYIVADVNEERLDGVYADVLPYSAKHKLFNTFDETMAAAARRAALDVTYWMPLPEPPEESGV